MLDHLEPAEDVALGVGQRLALLGRQRAGDARQVLADQRLVLEHDAHAGAHRGVLPGGERGVRRADGRIHLIPRGERHARQHLLRGRVHHLAPLGRAGFDELAPDQQLDGRLRAGMPGG